MGSFLGHVFPGFFFASFALWWTYNIFLRYHSCKRTTAQGGAGAKIPYVSSCTFPCRCFPRLPVESCVKVVLVIGIMTGELVTAFEDGHFVNLVNAQHMTMYLFFGLNGFVEILMHYRAPVPPALDYVSSAFAFCMEGVLLLYHLHGRTPMDIQLHMLLVYVVAGSIVSTVLEMYHRRSVMPALMRCYFAMLQGTWLIQAGFVLYPPVGSTWDENDHGQMMVVTAIFCWHNATVFGLMLIINFLVHAQVKVLTTTGMYRLLHPLGASSSPSPSPSAAAQFSKMDSEQVRRIIDESEEEDVQGW